MADKVKLSGEMAIAKSLKECGVDCFFFMRGGPGSLFERIEEEGLNMFLCRSELGACGMADGYSRITKKPSACFAQHGAAAAILASMLYEPMYAHSPVIALTGSTPTREKDKWQYQECYEKPYFESTCKFSADVTDVCKLNEYIRTAVQIAVSGCPGPTHVTWHNDMLKTVEEMPQPYGDKKFSKIPPFRPKAEPDMIMKAAKLLLTAERPVILCGSGVHISGAYEEVEQLAELLSIPIATNFKGKGCFSEDHPLSIGVAGSYGREVTNEIIRESNLVFFLATRADKHMTEDHTAPEPGKTKIIHLDIDPTVFNRNYRADVALLGDVKATLQNLLTVLKNMMVEQASKERYQHEFSEAIRNYEEKLRPMMDSDAIPIKPQRLMKEISQALRSEDILVSDTGHQLCWTTRFLKIKKPGLTYVPCGGTLGSSFPLALGIAFGAKKGQRVLNVIGDGGITYNLGELETAKRYNDKHVPLVALINNNSSLSQTRLWHETWTQKSSSWINLCDFNEINYAKIAEAFGCYGVRIENPNEISKALNEAFESGKPAIVDVISDKKEYAPIGLSRKRGKTPLPGFPAY